MHTVAAGSGGSLFSPGTHVDGTFFGDCGILIFAVGAGVSIYEGIHRVQHPVPITNVGINYAVLAIGSDGAGSLYDSVEGLPTIIFIDPQGRIKLATTGLMPLDDFKAVLEAEWPKGTFGSSGE